MLNRQLVKEFGRESWAGFLNVGIDVPLFVAFKVIGVDEIAYRD